MAFAYNSCFFVLFAIGFAMESDHVTLQLDEVAAEKDGVPAENDTPMKPWLGGVSAEEEADLNHLLQDFTEEVGSYQRLQDAQEEVKEADVFANQLTGASFTQSVTTVENSVGGKKKDSTVEDSVRKKKKKTKEITPPDLAKEIFSELEKLFSAQEAFNFSATFHAADTNKNNLLERKEFKDFMKKLHQNHMAPDYSTKERKAIYEKCKTIKDEMWKTNKTNTDGVSFSDFMNMQTKINAEMQKLEVQEKLCTSLAGTMVQSKSPDTECPAAQNKCASIDFKKGASIDFEDGDILKTLCKGVIAKVCHEVVKEMVESEIKGVKLGATTITGACKEQVKQRTG